MLKLHPQILKKNGRSEFVVLSYSEYQAIRQALEDAGDVLALRAARSADDGSRRGLTIDDVRKEMGLTVKRKLRGKTGGRKPVKRRRLVQR